MRELSYTIPLPPVTKKNHLQIRINRQTGKRFVAQSDAYRDYAQKAVWYLRPRPTEPIREPVEVCCRFYMPTLRRVDLTNLLEAADDILVDAGVLADDHSGILVSHDGSRVLLDRQRPRTEIRIRRLDPEKGKQD